MYCLCFDAWLIQIHVHVCTIIDTNLHIVYHSLSTKISGLIDQDPLNIIWWGCRAITWYHEYAYKWVYLQCYIEVLIPNKQLLAQQNHSSGSYMYMIKFVLMKLR